MTTTELLRNAAAAYDEKHCIPIHSKYVSVEPEGICCCVLSAAYLYLHGERKTLKFMKKALRDNQLSLQRQFEIALNLENHDYTSGLLHAFDWRADTHSLNVDFARGYADGVVMRLKYLPLDRSGE